jgi:hypothetical protein
MDVLEAFEHRYRDARPYSWSSNEPEGTAEGLRHLGRTDAGI